VTRASNRACPICGTVPHDGERRVLVLGRSRRSYCSQACLHTGVRVARAAQRKAQLRAAAIVLSAALVVAGGAWVRHVVLRPRPQRAVVATPPPAPPAPDEPTPFGPSWPPTDEEWQEQFAQATWVYPLPGPTRRRAVSARQLLLADPPGRPPSRCRTAGRCGVDLGGELWGEHVYAAHDGVIDRVQASSDDAPGGVYVRVAHWGGAVFTQYFHLAAVPTSLRVGMHVAAGDVIGLLGDTGLADPRAHLRFALSVRPSKELPEVYWDPEPLMADWPARTPERGSVAGLLSPEAPPEHIAGSPSAHGRAR
jgi:murein DD-endopeptidase MepM/ murein hydrolase activator NlpD